MNKIVRVLVITTAMVAACAALAQGGERQGGGRGQGFGGGQAFGMGGGEMALATNALVQAELKLTDAQKQQLTDLQNRQREEMRARMEEMRSGGGGGGFDRDAMMEEMRKRQEAQNKALQGILTKEQYQRVREINVQLQGGRALMNPEVQKELALTDAQKKQITDIQARQQEANRALGERARNGEITREEATAARQKNDETLSAELAKVLTADQAAKFKTMSGTPFADLQKLRESMRGGRGGGGGN